MTTPSVTLRSLKNTDTSIDISVPRFQEEEAPLGGVSILYEISILTNLDLFKTRLHRDEDIVYFSVFKAHREIEDLANKLSKKYPKISLPRVPKASAADNYSNDEKVKTFDAFMGAIAKSTEISQSSLFTQFIGINLQKQPLTNIPNSQSSESATNTQSEVFHKMKNVEKLSTKTVETSQSTKAADLFEEEKKAKTSVDVKSSSSQGLFDEFDDDNLFSSKPTEKKPVQQKQNIEIKKAEKPAPKKQAVVKSVPDKIDDSQIIIKDRKLGDVSLFDEQDLGDYITKEEEALFLVTAPTTKTKQNFLLSPKNQILSPDKDDDLNDNLDDLLNLVPLPVSPAAEKPPKVDVQEKESSAPQKPVPLPRKKSLSKDEPEIVQKPKVMPRKVFLNKNDDIPKSTTAAPPSIPPKPVMPSAGATRINKPKPPTKPKPPARKPSIVKESETKTSDLDTENANRSEANDNSPNTVTNLSDQLKDLDILKYIEQEQKSLDSNLSLFD